MAYTSTTKIKPMRMFGTYSGLGISFDEAVAKYSGEDTRKSWLETADTRNANLGVKVRLGFALCAAQPWPPLGNLALRKSSEKFD